MLSNEQLLCFVTTVDEGSFSAAARKLSKVQSAVSQQVINMEIDCGHSLFERSGRYPTLTEAGQRLLPYARAVLSQQQRLERQLTLLDMALPNRLTLAHDEGIEIDKTLMILRLLAEKQPGLSIELLSASSSDIIKMVQQGRANAGLVFSETLYPEGVDFESVGGVHFEPVVASHHPLAAMRLTHVDELKLHRQLVIGSRAMGHSVFSAPHSPDVWYADNYHVLLTMVQEGFGWALLPSHLVRDGLASATLMPLPVDFEALGWHANVDIIQHQSLSMQPLGKELRALVRDEGVR
ncbi:LysR family transcriptional regulator [Shewanella zhangzhouensis]|uniref:LysR family transcriptional regulator n=1 Tax=Shewanella zhangzhouensis TaxID=2864213 RepID=UPI001C6588A8|nr:LysR family transcriptional regulator [Shewanella zhangzhouensis]QYK04138.1 LysR family transcriptional regulator [Shewanella zhangzhouensis]